MFSNCNHGCTNPSSVGYVDQDSILNSVKKLLGLDVNFKAFDADIIMHINSVFFIMEQMGIGPQFMIFDESDLWSTYLEGRTDLEAVKTYMGAKVRQMFDPPTSSILADALDRTVKELEWRLFSATDLTVTKPEDLIDYAARERERRRKKNSSGDEVKPTPQPTPEPEPEPEPEPDDSDSDVVDIGRVGYMIVRTE